MDNNTELLRNRPRHKQTMGKQTKHEQTVPPLQKCSIVGILMFNRLVWHG